MQYLFQVAIGPVQGFIASARRSRDLWFGSRLLSEISKIVALTIYTIPNKNHEFLKSSLIFPAPESLKELEFDSDLNVANKIVACITIPDNLQGQASTVLENLGKEIRTNIGNKINEIKDRVYREIERNAKNAECDGEPFNQKMANQQIDDLVELSWAAVPYHEGQYNEARKKLDRLMAARKNTRNFRKVRWGSEQPKSSIDGQLEGVISSDRYPQRQESTAEQFEKARSLYNRFHAGPAERLSGVDLLKRRGIFKGEGQASTSQTEIQLEQDDFLSTSHIAAIPYLECLQRLDETTRTAAKKLLDRYVKALESVLYDPLDTLPEKYKLYPILARDNGKWYDGALFYPERHFDKLTKGRDLKGALQELQSFFKLVKEKLPEATPSPYYAIICADGDRMGELIDTLAGDDEGMSKHQELSKALDRFSREVKGIVEKHKGAQIYAGGDDVLAFLPLHSVLDCARELADTFSKDLQPLAKELAKDKQPSLSVGIAIVHHLTMLHEALDLGRAAEKQAKGVKGKNALAITVNKRSGEQYSVAGHRETLHSTLQDFIKYFWRDYLPKGVAYELRATQERLTVIDAKKSDDAQKLKEIMYLEAKRILRRKLNLPQSKLSDNMSIEERQKQDEERKERAKAILNKLLAHIEGAAEPAKGSPDKTAKVPLAEFIQALIVAQELAAAKTLAEGKPPVEAQSSKEGNIQ